MQVRSALGGRERVASDALSLDPVAKSVLRYVDVKLPDTVSTLLSRGGYTSYGGTGDDLVGRCPDGELGVEGLGAADLVLGSLQLATNGTGWEGNGVRVGEEGTRVGLQVAKPEA